MMGRTGKTKASRASFLNIVNLDSSVNFFPCTSLDRETENRLLT
jgi:hypothetical protein